MPKNGSVKRARGKPAAAVGVCEVGLPCPQLTCSLRIPALSQQAREACSGAPLQTGLFGRASDLGRLVPHPQLAAEPPASPFCNPLGSGFAVLHSTDLGSGSAGARAFLPWPVWCRVLPASHVAGAGFGRLVALLCVTGLHVLLGGSRGTAVAVGCRLSSRCHAPTGAGDGLPLWATQAWSVLGAGPFRCPVLGAKYHLCPWSQERQQGGMGALAPRRTEGPHLC